MSFLPRLAAALAVAGLATVTPAGAESIASSASSAGSASVGSVSESLRGSSASSSPDRDEVAEGEYRVLQVAAADARPGRLRLTLQAAARAGVEGRLLLEVPEHALARRALAAGDGVWVRRRAYGWEFAHADTREAFFLALADAWMHELDARPVGL